MDAYHDNNWAFRKNSEVCIFSNFCGPAAIFERFFQVSNFPGWQTVTWGRKCSILVSTYILHLLWMIFLTRICNSPFSTYVKKTPRSKLENCTRKIKLKHLLR